MRSDCPWDLMICNEFDCSSSIASDTRGPIHGFHIHVLTSEGLRLLEIMWLWLRTVVGNMHWVKWNEIVVETTQSQLKLKFIHFLSHTDFWFWAVICYSCCSPNSTLSCSKWTVHVYMNFIMLLDLIILDLQLQFACNVGPLSFVFCRVGLVNDAYFFWMKTEIHVASGNLFIRSKIPSHM